MIHELHLSMLKKEVEVPLKDCCVQFLNLQMVYLQKDLRDILPLSRGAKFQ